MGADGTPHLVPIVHVVVDDVIVFAVDHKPKSGRRLRRLDNITAEPRVSVLFDFRSDDWNQLWWVRADGIASIHHTPPPEAAHLHRAHAQYASDPPAGPWVRIEVHGWSGWSAMRS